MMKGHVEVHERLAGRPAVAGAAARLAADVDGRAAVPANAATFRAGTAARLAADVGPCEGGLRHEESTVLKTRTTAAFPTDSRTLAMAVILATPREIARAIDHSWKRFERCGGLRSGLPPRAPENGSARPSLGCEIAHGVREPSPNESSLGSWNSACPRSSLAARGSLLQLVVE